MKRCFICQDDAPIMCRRCTESVCEPHSLHQAAVKGRPDAPTQRLCDKCYEILKEKKKKKEMPITSSKQAKNSHDPRRTANLKTKKKIKNLPERARPRQRREQILHQRSQKPTSSPSSASSKLKPKNYPGLKENSLVSTMVKPKPRPRGGTSRSVSSSDDSSEDDSDESSDDDDSDEDSDDDSDESSDDDSSQPKSSSSFTNSDISMDKKVKQEKPKKGELRLDSDSEGDDLPKKGRGLKVGQLEKMGQFSSDELMQRFNKQNPRLTESTGSLSDDDSDRISRGSSGLKAEMLKGIGKLHTDEIMKRFQNAELEVVGVGELGEGTEAPTHPALKNMSGLSASEVIARYQQSVYKDSTSSMSPPVAPPHFQPPALASAAPHVPSYDPVNFGEANGFEQLAKRTEMLKQRIKQFSNRFDATTAAAGPGATPVSSVDNSASLRVSSSSHQAFPAHAGPAYSGTKAKDHLDDLSPAELAAMLNQKMLTSYTASSATTQNSHQSYAAQASAASAALGNTIPIQQQHSRLHHSLARTSSNVVSGSRVIFFDSSGDKSKKYTRTQSLDLQAPKPGLPTSTTGIPSFWDRMESPSVIKSLRSPVGATTPGGDSTKSSNPLKKFFGRSKSNSDAALKSPLAWQKDADNLYEHGLEI